MNEKTVYLDSSAVVKRYLVEDGTEAIDDIYRRAEAGEIRIALSLWNIGEILRAFMKTVRRGLITEKGAEVIAWAFLRETLKLRGLGGLRILSVRGDLLARLIPLIFRHGIGQADGLQITSSKELRAAALVSSDEVLIRVARAEGLTALHPVDNAREIRAL